MKHNDIEIQLQKEFPNYKIQIEYNYENHTTSYFNWTGCKLVDTTITRNTYSFIVDGMIQYCIDQVDYRCFYHDMIQNIIPALTKYYLKQDELYKLIGEIDVV